MQREPLVDAVLLAAGCSLRMGRPKQLLTLNGDPLIVRCLRCALDSELDHVVVVLGYRAKEVRISIAHFVSHARVDIVVNPRYDLGMSESMKAGLRCLEKRSSMAAMILFCDQPFLTERVINSVIDGYRESGKPICQPYYEGSPGHPVIFDRSLFPALMNVNGDQGGRGIIRTHPEWVHRVTFSDPTPGIDLDTIEDYEHFRNRSNQPTSFKNQR